MPEAPFAPGGDHEKHFPLSEVPMKPEYAALNPDQAQEVGEAMGRFTNPGVDAIKETQLLIDAQELLDDAHRKAVLADRPSDAQAQPIEKRPSDFTPDDVTKQWSKGLTLLEAGEEAARRKVQEVTERDSKIAE